MTDSPVVIVGGGPVGMACALLLARHGVPSTVLEAATRRTAGGSRSICTQRDVLDILDRVGCADAALAEGVTWTLGRTYYRDTQVATITFPEVGRSAYPPFINIPQTSIEGYLEERLLAEPAITLHRGVAITDLAQDADGVTVLAAERRWRASWLVGCDGARSTVRRLLGVPFPGESFDDQFLICDIRADLSFPAERRFYFDPPWNPGRQVLVHPQPGGVWRIDWQVPADFDLAAERARGALDERIRAITGDAPYEVIWSSQYRFQQRIVPEFRIGRCLLAGDAAYVMAPFGARGLNSGLADAENAAWKLAHAVRGWAPQSLVGTYHDERHAAGVENLRVTGDTMRFLVPATEADRAHRLRVLRAALTDPAASAEIDSGRLAEPYRYTDSPLTTPAPGTPKPGDLAPDGPCEVAGESTRLRRALGPQWTVLSFGAGPPPATGGVTGGVTGADVRYRRVVSPGAPTGPGDITDTDGFLRLAYLSDAAIPVTSGAGKGTISPAAAVDGPVWLVRPDGYLAGVVRPAEPDTTRQLRHLLHRAINAPTG
jgi:2-polyprenyl-6-methoxyphenol hydroxylase-like FAD-dependent oxidoreductase